MKTGVLEHNMVCPKCRREYSAGTSMELRGGTFRCPAQCNQPGFDDIPMYCVGELKKVTQPNPQEVQS